MRIQAIFMHIFQLLLRLLSKPVIHCLDTLLQLIRGEGSNLLVKFDPGAASHTLPLSAKGVVCGTILDVVFEPHGQAAAFLYWYLLF